jgi:RNA polymerase sigma-70 factor (ECF subfamily)
VTAALPSGALASASEVSIVLLAMNGDDAAYNELVRRRHGAMRNMLRRLTRDPYLADDIAQQAFVQGWQSIGGLKTPAAFPGWLRQIAVNFWLQAVRSRKLEVPLDEELRTESKASATTEQLDLDAALSKLPADVRLCIVLAYSEGLSHAEIGQTTSIPLGTVKSHINRGSARLRELLPGYGESHAR